MMLLPDGSVMAQQAGITNHWYRLTPDASGSYATGTWTQAASMNYSRLYFTSDILSNDELLVIGGEYSNATTTTNGSLTNTAEMYDMATNAWTNLASVPTSLVGSFTWNPGSDSGTPFGDDPSMVLPDGKILCGFIFNAKTLIYDPVANVWSLGPNKLHSDQSDEENWVKLPNGNILSYDVYTTSPSAQMFVPDPNPAIDHTEGQWVDAGTPPIALASSSSHELGPGSLLPDGDVFYEGATGHTALYHYQTNTWTQDPDILSSSGSLMGADDAPAAVLPNGNVLFTADSVSKGAYQPPTAIFDYDPVANTITQVADLPDMTLSGEP
ncbi:MAG: kelch repeat-containing protein, partial [Pirellulales bacterium]